MLASFGCMFQSDGGLALHHKPIKVFRQQDGNGLGQSPEYAGLDVVDFVENAKSSVLEDRISVQY